MARGWQRQTHVQEFLITEFSPAAPSAFSKCTLVLESALSQVCEGLWSLPFSGSLIEKVSSSCLALFLAEQAGLSNRNLTELLFTVCIVSSLQQGRW